MDHDEEAGQEVATMEDLASVRRDLIGQLQELHRELALARQRIRQLEVRASLDPNRIGYQPP
jgi:predicted component of type VI protein secretion system